MAGQWHTVKWQVAGKLANWFGWGENQSNAKMAEQSHPDGDKSVANFGALVFGGEGPVDLTDDEGCCMRTGGESVAIFGIIE